MLARLIGLALVALSVCSSDLTAQVLRVTHLAGSPGGPGSTDGQARAARFNRPSGVAVGHNGTIYIADTDNHTIRTLSPDGYVSTLAGVADVWGSRDGLRSAARFEHPGHLAVDGSGNLYVTTSSDWPLQTLRRVTPAGEVTTLGFSGRAPKSNGPLAAASDGTLYIADPPVILRRAPDGTTTVFTGKDGFLGHRDGDRDTAILGYLTALALAPDGSLYFTDQSGTTLRRADSDGRVTTLGSYSHAGPLAVGPDGTVYVASSTVIYKVTAGGQQTLAGGFQSGIGGLAIEPGGTLIVSSFQGWGGVIRRVTADGWVTTIAGGGTTAGSTDGAGEAASFSGPSDIAVGPDATVYVADTDNHTIRSIAPTGVVSTLAGAAGQQGHVDGTRAVARFNVPHAIAVDQTGSLFIADSQALRKIAPNGDVSTVDGGSGYTVPAGLAVDPHGVIYTTDGNVIRRIGPAGGVSVLAGSVPSTGSVDGVGTAASFSSITGLDVDVAGNVYVTERGRGGSLRMVTPEGVVSTCATNVPGGADGVAVAAGSVYVCGSTIVRYAPDRTATIVAGAMGMNSNWRSDDGIGGAARFSGGTTIAVAPSGTVFLAHRVFNAIRRGEPVPWPYPDSDADGLPDSWESSFGLHTWLAAGDDGPTGDADFDGVTNGEEYAQQSHPTGLAAATRYFAEGATLAPFDTEFAIANPGGVDARVLLRFLRPDGVTMSTAITVPPLQQGTVAARAVPGMDGREFSTVLESDQPVVTARRMAWPRDDPYGAHAERAQLAPAPQWYLAEGATHSGFDLFYLLQNPNAVEAQARVTYLRPHDPPIEKTYTLPPQSRTNIWVNTEEIPGLGRALSATDLSARIETGEATPILVERAMYLSRPGRLFDAGHDAAGVPAPATAWFLAEGATGPYFDLFILVANPTDDPAEATLTYLRADGASYTHALTAAPQSRTTVWVDRESFDGGATFPLADSAVSTTVASTNGVPLVVERAMWWPGDVATWHEAHATAASTETAARWVAAGGQVLEAPRSDTYVLLANPASASALVRVTLLFEDGTAPVSKTFDVAPQSRFNVDARAEFSVAVGKRFGALVESLGEPPVPIVVESAVYHDAGGVRWAAGTNALATPVK